MGHEHAEDDDAAPEPADIDAGDGHTEDGDEAREADDAPGEAGTDNGEEPMD